MRSTGQKKAVTCAMCLLCPGLGNGLHGWWPWNHDPGVIHKCRTGARQKVPGRTPCRIYEFNITIMVITAWCAWPDAPIAWPRMTRVQMMAKPDLEKTIVFSWSEAVLTSSMSKCMASLAPMCGGTMSDSLFGLTEEEIEERDRAIFNPFTLIENCIWELSS